MNVFLLTVPGILILIAKEIKDLQEVYEYQMGKIKDYDAPVEVIEKYLNYKGIEVDFRISLGMSRQNCKELYKKIFGTDTVIMGVDNRTLEEF